MKGGLVGLIIFCALIAGVFFGPDVSADVVDWGSGEPVLARNEPVAGFEPDIHCPTYRQSFKVTGLERPQDICVFQGLKIRLGTLFVDGTAPRLAIAYNFDTQFHLVEGVCEGISGCLYSPNSDTLASRFYSPPLLSRAVVFKRASERVLRTFDTATMSFRYMFDTSAPNNPLSDISGNPLSIGSMAMSDNGRWLAAELKDLGTLLMNLETGQLRRVIAPGMRYGVGMDPREEIAVSNEGGVVVMGMNSGISFVQIMPTCGDSLAEGLSVSFGAVTERCQSVSIEMSRAASSARFGYHPHFDSGGGELRFYIAAPGNNRYVVFRAAGYEHTAKLQYLALGDSFTSGEGESDDAYYLPDTNVRYGKCHTSSRSYPFLFARALEIERSQVKNIACAGARTKDISSDEANYTGQSDRLGVKGKKLSENDRRGEQTAALVSFTPGLILQSSFLARYQPEMVTLGIGGNDAGFMDKLKTCAMPDTCEWVNLDMRQKVATEINGLFDKLVSLYRKLLSDSPLSRLSIIGYPKVIDPDGVCDPLTVILLNHKERQFMDEGITYINRMIKSAAETVGLQYYDIEQSFEGRELCSSSSLPSAMNGFRFGDDIPVSSHLPMLKLIGGETFHPTPAGHQLIADAITTQYHSPSIARTDSTEYWEQGEPHNELLRSEEFLDSDQLKPGDSLAINIPSESFLPNSSVSVEVHSDTQVIGVLAADAQGGLVGFLNMPSTLNEGFHTIHLRGTSYTNQAIDLYQVISYGFILESAQAFFDENTSYFQIENLPLLAGAATLGLSDSVLNNTAQYAKAIAADIVTSNTLYWILIALGIIAIMVIGTIIAILRRNSSQDRGG